jgi:hypothetical protein
LQQLPEKFTIFREKYQQKILIFLFFVIISIVFWLIRSLNQEYEADILYPVKYDDFPENKVLVNKLPEKLKLRVRAVGFTILGRKYIHFLSPLKFNVNSYSLNTIGTDSSYILTKTAREVLSNALENIRILDISPDTLFFHFTDMITKKVEIRYNIVNFPDIFTKQYMLNGEIYSDFDSIIISGPSNIIDTLSYVCTEPIFLFNLSDTVHKSYQIEKIDQVAFSRKKVKITVPVDKFTELSHLIAIQHMNLPDSLILKIFPNSVRITYRITLSQYNKVREEMFQPYVDFNEVESSLNSKLKVFLNDTPEYIHSLVLYPSSVEFLIEKND